MAFGPDNNLPMNYNQTISIIVPPKHQAHMLFSTDAAWENAICIYLGDTQEKVSERGNYGRKLNDWSTPINNTSHPIRYVISGWHKNTPPNGGQPWHQSPAKVALHTPDAKAIGFEDGADADFNDIVALVKVELV
jgi:hypothetical protein